MSAARLKKCPKCGKAGLKRLIGAGAGLIFKGTGFYITDYKKTQAPKEGGEGKPGGGEAKPAEKPADSKPAKGEGGAPSKEAKAAQPAPKTEVKAKT